MHEEVELLGPAEIREIARAIDLRPTKRLGQNFVHDPNTVRRIVAAAKLTADDVVLEVGPGLGSLTLGLLQAVRVVHALEVDPVLAGRLPETVARHAPAYASRLRVLVADALRARAEALHPAPTRLVANLPYNVAVPVVLHLLAELPTVAGGLVMVQSEVADRLVAAPGSRTYGAPSVKLAWYATAHRAGSVPRSVFWPVPGVDSALVAFERGRDREAPCHGNRRDDPREVFRLVDAAFGQRRKTLRAALATVTGSPARAESALRRAGIEPSARGEQLTIEDFAVLTDTVKHGRCADGEL